MKPSYVSQSDVSEKKKSNLKMPIEYWKTQTNTQEFIHEAMQAKMAWINGTEVEKSVYLHVKKIFDGIIFE